MAQRASWDKQTNKRGVQYYSTKGTKHIPRSGQTVYNADTVYNWPGRFGGIAEDELYVRGGRYRKRNNKYGTNSLMYLSTKSAKTGKHRKIGKHFDVAVIKAVRALRDERAIMLTGKGARGGGGGKARRGRTTRQKGKIPAKLAAFVKPGHFSSQALYARQLGSRLFAEAGKPKGEKARFSAQAREILKTDPIYASLKGKFTPAGQKLNVRAPPTLPLPRVPQRASAEQYAEEERYRDEYENEEDEYDDDAIKG